MPPASSNKWTADAERDLAMAILLSNGSLKYDWNAVTATMSSWGYNFTSGSVSQHWTKRVLKDFKARRADDGTTAKEPGTPKSATKPKTPASGSKRKAMKEESDGEETPSKKAIKNETPSKKAFKEESYEERRATRSVTGDESNDFEEMMEECGPE